MSTLTHIIVKAEDELWAMPSVYAYSTHYVDSLMHIPFTPKYPWGGMGLVDGQVHAVILLQNYIRASPAESAVRAMPKQSWLILLEPVSWRVCMGVDRIVGYAEDLVVMHDASKNMKAKYKSHWKGAPVWVLDVALLLKTYNLLDPGVVADSVHGTK
ncbi:MAG TPA: hypothetical protein PLV25_06535 [Opitutales bacterium]|nr:hypothetical protein [Opitutales bacterium]